MIDEDCVWMKVTDDKYEFPVIIADTAVELAEKVGKSVNTIYSSVSHTKNGRCNKSIYRKVVIEEDGGVNGANRSDYESDK